MRLNKNQQGFTLVELLIVIVIIGILAAIVLSVLNPARQQNRAKDAVVISSINKIATEAKAFAVSNISSTPGYFPTCAEIAVSLSGVATSPCGVNTSFTITGVTTGTAGSFTGFRYTSATDVSFCVSAPANDTSGGAYIRLNTVSEQAPVKAATGC